MSDRDDVSVVCFHNPDEENGYLSNWYPSDFESDGVAFSSVEQCMLYRKARCFHDEVAASKIASTDDVAQIKALGRKVAPYDDHHWGGIRQIVVYEGLLAKFTQNEPLREQLLSTSTAILAECAVRDRVWGIGLSTDDARRLDRSRWRGQNLLGYALMMVRDRLS